MTCARRAGLLVALLLAGAAEARDFVQLRYFVPSSGLSGLALDGAFSARAPDRSLQVRVPELSLETQHFSVSATLGGLFAFGSGHLRAAEGTATFTAVLGYAATEPGPFTDAALTVVRAADARPDVGYALTGLALDLRGQLSPAWRWNANAAFDETRLNDPASTTDARRTATLGVQGRVGEADLRARARLAQASSSPDELRWNVALDAAVPLGPTERVEAALELDRASGDRERLALTSTRVPGVSLTGAVQREAQTLGARFSAATTSEGPLSLSGEYGVSRRTDGALGVAHDAALGLEYRASEGSVTGAVTAELAPEAGAAFGARLSAQWRAAEWTLAARASARLAPAQLSAWAYSADLTAETRTGPVGWVLTGRLESPTSSRPLTGEAAVQALVDLAPNLALNTTARVRTGASGPAAQFGLGLRHAF